MIVKVCDNELEMSTDYGIALRDALTEALTNALPGGLKYAREDVETGEPLPANVQGFCCGAAYTADPCPEHPVAAQWAPYIRVDPDLRTPGGAV